MARNVTPCSHSWVAKFHSKSLYSVEKKIVGISQYAYFSCIDYTADSMYSPENDFSP
jgi:hypothetical protein